MQYVNHAFKVECDVALSLFLLFIYVKKQLFISLKMLLKISLLFIMINKLNADQALNKIRRLEKVQHIDSAQRSQADGPSHGRTGRYTLV